MSAALKRVTAWGVVSGALREGLRAPARVGICEWAEREVRILKGPVPGRLKLGLTPYLRGMIEAFTEPGVRDITYKTASQVAKTTAILIETAFVIAEDPGDALYVMPDEDLAKEICLERIQPMLEKSPAVKRQFTKLANDQQGMRMRFLRSTLFFGWAKSPAKLASRPVRYVFLDETGKYPPFSGKEANPVKLAQERNKLFFNRKTVVASTPTTPTATVSERFEASDKRRYWVPCAKCQTMQLLISQHLKWPPHVEPDTIDAEDLAWYECPHCHARLTDSDKRWMLERGEWRAERAEVRGHRGFHLNTLYSPLVRWSTYAKEFLISKDTPKDLMNFVNSWEGEDWIERAAPVTEDSIKALRVPYTMGVVPLGGLLLTCGADVMEDYVKYVVRAWGVGKESWLVDYGLFLRTRAENGLWKDDDLDQLGEQVFNTRYECADKSEMRISLAFVDSGYRTTTVYAFTKKWRQMAMAVKGENEEQVDGKDKGKILPLREMDVPKMPGLRYTRVNTTYYKDWMQTMREDARKVWHIPEDIGDDYLREVSAEHKMIVRDARGQGKHVWALRPGYKHNHWGDCEVYATAAADKRRFTELRAGGEGKPQPRRGGIKMPDGRAFSILKR